MHDPTRFIENLTRLQRNVHQAGKNPCIFFSRQTAQNAIADRSGPTHAVGQGSLLLSADRACPVQLTTDRQSVRHSIMTARTLSVVYPPYEGAQLEISACLGNR